VTNARTHAAFHKALYRYSSRKMRIVMSFRCKFIGLYMYQQLLHCGTFWQSYFKNKMVQFFCPTVYSVKCWWRLWSVQPIHICMTQTIEYDDRPPRGLEHRSSYCYFVVFLMSMNMLLRSKVVSWEISGNLFQSFRKFQRNLLKNFFHFIYVLIITI